MPTNLVPPGHHRVIEMARGDIVWGAEWLAPVRCTGFDFEIAEDMLVFEYRSIVEYQSSEGWDRFGILDTERAACTDSCPDDRRLHPPG